MQTVLVSYEDVAKWLRPEIRQAIETSLPCPVAADGRHIWDSERSELAAMDAGSSPIRVYEWWRCVHCGLTSTLNPVPVDQRPEPLHTASEHYSMLTYGEAIR